VARYFLSPEAKEDLRDIRAYLVSQGRQPARQACVAGNQGGFSFAGITS
jgi:plasmid stabilization system protein ParE